VTRRLVAACAVAAVALPGCWLPGHTIGVEMRNKTQFESEWKDYCEAKPFKTLAFAGDVDGVYVSGLVTNAASQEEARSEALRACERRRIDMRIPAACRIYFEGECPPAPP